VARLCARGQWQTCDRERDGVERGRMTASGVRMGDAIEMAGDEKGGDVWEKRVPKNACQP